MSTVTLPEQFAKLPRVIINLDFSYRTKYQMIDTNAILCRTVLWHDYQYRRHWSDMQINFLSKRMPASWIVSSANFKVMQLITCNTSQSESLFIVTYLTSTVNKYTKVKTWRRTHMTDATPHQVSTNNCVITNHNVVYMTPHTCELNRNRINNWKCIAQREC